LSIDREGVLYFNQINIDLHCLIIASNRQRTFPDVKFFQNAIFYLRSNLRLKVTLGVVLPLLLIMGVFTGIEYRRQKAVLLKNLSSLSSHSGKIIEDNLRQQMVRTDFAGMQQLLDSIGASEGFRRVDLIDTSGNVIFAPGGEDVGQHLDNSQPECQPCHSLPPDERPSSIVVTTASGERVFRSMNPIENSSECVHCHGDSTPLIGVLLTDISTAPFERALNEDLRENLLWSGLMILVVVLVVNLALSHFVLQRLEGFAAPIRALGRGRIPSPLPDDQPDEIGQLAGAFNNMARQVKTRDVENTALSQSLREQSARRGELLTRLITAQEDERQRVARELHDDLGQGLSGLALQVQVTQKYLQGDPERARQQLDAVRDLITDTTDRMYDLILALRPSALDDLGLAAALRAHIERCSNGSGVEFHIDAQGLPDRLPEELEITLYRIFQEGISNVVRHAHATQANITLARHNGTFEGQISDNGAGFDPHSVRLNGGQARGLGLMGMHERVHQWGGTLQIQSQPGAGTRIAIQVPIPEVSND
jgi:signal transduction histidine kinase